MKTSQRIRTEALIYHRYKGDLAFIPQQEIELFRFEVEWAYIQTFSTSNIKVKFVEGQPYETVEQMSDTIRTSGLLLITADFNNNSLLLPGELNLQFRAAHDYLHHLFNLPFGYKGERDVWKIQRFYHSTEMGKKILYSEICLQAAYAEYFGKFSEKQKVVII